MIENNYGKKKMKDSETWKWLKDIWRRVPKVAVIMILFLIFTAICADLLALHDPEIGERARRHVRVVDGRIASDTLRA